MAKQLYPAVFHPEEDGYSVSAPDFDGCFTDGDTLEEAYDMIFDAIGLCVEDLRENGWQLPAASNPASLQLDPGEFVALIEFDPLSYAKKHDTRAVKKTLSIPAWLNNIAEERHVNFSGILKEALIEHLDIR